MKKPYLLISAALLLTTTVLAFVNLDFKINLEDKVYYPNETIDLTLSVINRDSFTAKNATLTLFLEKRTYTYELGDLKAYDTFTKQITLPEFPPSTHTMKGVLNYTGIFDERFTLETYNSFEVRFPEVQRFPRNVNVVSFGTPEKVFGGKSYTIPVTVRNDGDVIGNLIIELASGTDSFASESVILQPGETKTLSLTPTFKTTGVSLVEARVYAIVDGIKYLLTYSGKEIFVQEEHIAKLALGSVEVVGKEGIRQNDEAQIKIYLQNTGGYSASGVKGTLTSSTPEIEVVDNTVDYTLVSPGDNFAPEQDTFSIKTKNANVQGYNLKLDVDYADSEQRRISFDVPLNIKEDRCESNKDCASNQVCSNNKCQDLECGFCQYPRENKCERYECCSDSDCPSLYTCDTKLHTCKPPQCLQDWQCEDDEVCSTGKCSKAFTLLVVPLGLSESDKTKMISYSEKELSFFTEISPLKESAAEKKKIRVHYVDPSICSSYTSCTWRNSQACFEEINTCATKSGLIGAADKLVGIIDKPIGACGFAHIGGFWSVNLIGCEATIPHEMGHQFDLYHIKCRGDEGGACLGVNAADCRDANFKTDVMSYCSPETHYGPNAYTHLKKTYFNSFLEGGQ